ncbi:hypothetical protein BAUCODRAFT_121251 [Baudoinia panamericana UAMH 10762]|uniref:TLC domain-containing protein n=1 Tax=Baudoinia panamericana (strain UAMH 10762) TaxID=717646 RepID=M2LUU4_BAUPA|nr:uncharacterized protein BAUCODRAFT_121251 [Baudoinia panamericana UAMH 10762]EMC98382.1 hypothetical protein BAUCODRAFT_121251 [Baudoinia panamericana UAMH 10762]
METHIAPGSTHEKSNGHALPRRRRKNSSLGQDPHGDTDVGSIATNLARAGADGATSPTSPVSPAEQRSSGKQPRERKRRKALRLFRRWKRMSLRHTWVNPLVLLVILLSAYYISPGKQNPLYYGLFLAYENPPLVERTNSLPPHIGDVTQYGKGPLDFAFVAFYTLVFTFTREFIMQRFIKPIAIYSGIGARGKQARFMEQFYTAVYFAVFGPLGMYVMSRTPVWFFNTAGMYQGFPHRSHDAWFKAYYLLQAAYWLQQFIVLCLQLEKPRKDFKGLVLHHIITLALIGLSYRFHFTYMGVAVYVTHDISDFFLATSKVLNYLDSMFTIPYFVSFMVIWAYLRHYLNLVILKSLLPPGHIPFTSVPTGEFATVGPYELDWVTQQYKCWISQVITFFLLASLQAVNIFWFFLIVRILLRYVLAGVQKDERSEDEEEEETEDVAPVAVKANGHATKPGLTVNGELVSPVAVGKQE